MAFTSFHDHGLNLLLLDERAGDLLHQSDFCLIKSDWARSNCWLSHLEVAGMIPDHGHLLKSSGEYASPLKFCVIKGITSISLVGQISDRLSMMSVRDEPYNVTENVAFITTVRVTATCVVRMKSYMTY